MKKCPYCAEEILEEAKKCKHCGEFLDNNLRNEKTPQSQIPPQEIKVIAKEGCFLQTLNVGCMVIFSIIGLIVLFSIIGMCSRQ